MADPALSHSILHIVTLATLEQVCWINASGVITRMAHIALSDMAVVHHVRDAMCGPVLTLIRELSVALAINWTLPHPALIECATCNE